MQWLLLLMVALPLSFSGGAAPDVPDDEGGSDRVRDSFVAQCYAQGVPDPEVFAEDVGSSAQRCFQNSLDVLFPGRCHSLRDNILYRAKMQLTKMNTCLNKTERAKDYSGIMMKGLRAAVELLCPNDGEGIGISLGEKERQCMSVNDTQDSVRGCLRSHNLSENVFELFGSLLYGFTLDTCRRLLVAHDCVIAALRRHCEDSTAANVVDRLLLEFEKPLSCKRTTAGAAQPPLANCLVLLLSSALLLLLGGLW